MNNNHPAEAPEKEKRRMTTDTTWREICPAGATRWYEGDDPESFVTEIKEEFGFDPSSDANRDERRHYGEGGLKWGECVELDDGTRSPSYPFFCPPEHINAIYGSDRWPLGS